MIINTTPRRQPVNPPDPEQLSPRRPPPSKKWLDPAPEWYGRHHVLDSKDNGRVARARRCFFDGLPALRVRKGAYVEVPEYNAKNFDAVYYSSQDEIRRRLQSRFRRYPFSAGPRLLKASDAEETSDGEKADSLLDENQGKNRLVLPPIECARRNNTFQTDAMLAALVGSPRSPVHKKLQNFNSGFEFSLLCDEVDVRVMLVLV